MNYFKSVLLSIACSSLCFAQTVTMPATVTVPPGRALATVTIEYDGDDIAYEVPEELDVFTEATKKPNTIILKLIGYEAGKYTVRAVSVKDKKLSPFAKCVITFGGITPPKPPEPPVPPKPPEPPAPTGDLRVLFVYEAQSNLTRNQTLVLGGTVARAWLLANCVKDGTQAGFRYWDKDIEVTKEPEAWKSLWNATKSTLTFTKPQVVIFRGMSGKAFDLPETEEALIELLKKEGK